ncbi:MAG: hypothetical protein JWN18_397 [Parcubacteria group bacterium]|nr:hypothetical protein [Parcubacteria group bacterium]
MRGGFRLGSGRKPGFAAKNAEEARKLFSELLMKDIQPIAEALIVKAKNGDVAAARELFDRSWGKAIQATEISGSFGTPIQPLPPPIIDVALIGAT